MVNVTMLNMNSCPEFFVYVLDVRLLLFYDDFLYFLLIYLCLRMVQLLNLLSRIISVDKSGLNRYLNTLGLFLGSY